MNALARQSQELAQDRTAQCTYQPETVVVAFQGESEIRAALPVAKAMAQLQKATLHLVCVGGEARDAKAIVRQAGLSTEDIGVGIVNQASSGPDEAVRMATALPAPLIVACTYDTDKQEQSVGDISDAVLCAAPAQVLLVSADRGLEPWSVRRIVLAHDGTPSSDAAISVTADFAHRAGAQVVVLHVAARRCMQEHESGSLPAPKYVDQPQHEWPAWANEFVQRMMALGASPGAVNFQLLVAGGQPGSEIAQFARENKADLVVMAWHGQWKAERAGTLRVVARRSGCPVLLICAGQASSSEIAA